MVEIDVTGVLPGTLATLWFDLLGFGAMDAQVIIDDVVLASVVAIHPVATDDAVSTLEDESAVIDVLDNDADADGRIDSTTVVIGAFPEHGTLELDPLSGQITYVPDSNYSGPDSFTYSVSDGEALPSNVATVSIDVAPVADDPDVAALDARGLQDSAIPLEIFARLGDIDESEELTLEISGVPLGASLSAGTQIGPGVYRLTPKELGDLAIVPPAGSHEDFTLQVIARATELAGGDTATDSTELAVTVDFVILEQVQISDVLINDGADQRSEVQSISVTFNQDVWFVDLPSDVVIEDGDGQLVPLGADRYQYDSQSFTLTIDVTGVDLADDHYRLLLSTSRIGAVQNRNYLLADADFNRDDGVQMFGFHQLLADFNGDDDVDVADYDLLQPHLPSRSGEPGYDPVFDLDTNGVIDFFDYSIWHRLQGSTSDRFEPIVSAGLLNDTGRDATDGVTSDESIVGVVLDSSELVWFTASLDGGPAVDLLASLQNNLFFFTPDDLAAIGGAPLADGTHTLAMAAGDRYGNAMQTPMEVTFTLDTQAPTAPDTPQLVIASRFRRQFQRPDYQRSKSDRRHVGRDRQYRAALSRRGPRQPGDRQQPGRTSRIHVRVGGRDLHLHRHGRGSGRQLEHDLAAARRADRHGRAAPAGVWPGGRFGYAAGGRRTDHVGRRVAGGPDRSGRDG